MIELLLDQVTKRFGGRRVFGGVCAEARAGECLVITGPNGSGKSTLLAVIAGLIAPDAGAVRLRWGGREVTPDERRRRVGMVAPDLTLYGELTALENLEFFARLRGLAWDPAAGRELLDRAGLPGRGGDPAGTFSSGMRVRLKYAVALHAGPDLLLLDEPTAMLDEPGIRLAESVIAEQKARGILVLATNDPRETRHADLLLDLGSTR